MPVTPPAVPRRRVRPVRRGALALVTAAVAAGSVVAAAAPARAALDLTDGTNGATAAVAPAGTPVAASAAGDGSFVPVAAARIADTRSGLRVPRARVGSGATVTTQVTGHDGVPTTGVTAIVVNVTVTNASATSWLTLYPAGVSRPNASSINFPAGFTGANLVTVPVPASGSLAIFNAAGAADVVLDVVGYYSSADTTTTYGGYSPLPPQRGYNTRTDLPRSNLPMTDREFREIGWDFGALDPEVTALAVNITTANATSGGFVTAWSGSGTKPGTSSINFRAGVNVANFAIVQRGTVTAPGGAQVPSARFDLSTPGGQTEVIVDLVGAFTSKGHGDDARFVPLSAPTRILDTRTAGQGAPAMGPGQTRAFPSTPVATSDTLALAANLTLVAPTATTYLTAWPSDVAKPLVSSVNGNAGSTVANGALVGLSAPTATAPTVPGTYSLYNDKGTSQVLLDVAGLFVRPSAARTPLATPARVER